MYRMIEFAHGFLTVYVVFTRWRKVLFGCVFLKCELEVQAFQGVNVLFL